MCCFLVTLIALGPRFAILVYWLLRSAYVNQVFNTWIWPLLGLIFLPWTTLMWIIVYGVNGIIGFDWVWIALAVVADIATYTSGAYKRKSIPYYPENAP